MRPFNGLIAEKCMFTDNSELSPLNDETVYTARPRRGSAISVVTWGHLRIEV